MNTPDIIEASELVVRQMPYRDEFILTDMIRYTAQDHMDGKRFKELNYKDNGEDKNSTARTSIEHITGKLVNDKIVKKTRSVLNEGTGVVDQYYALTKLGRKMKGDDGLKTFDALKEWKKKKKRDKEEKKYKESLLLANQVDLHPIMREANNSVISTNINTVSTNRTLKIIFGFTMLIYLGQLFVSMYALSASKNETPKQALLEQRDSLIGTMGIRLCQIENQEHYLKSERDSLKNVLDSMIRKP